MTGRGPLIALISKRTYLGKKKVLVLHGCVLLLAENVKVILVFCPRRVSHTLGFTLEVNGQRQKASEK